MPLRAPRVVRRLIALFTWDRRDRDMEQEMAFHVESITRDLVASGMGEDEARRAARRRFGSVLQLKEEGHDVRSARIVEDVTRDARHMARGLRQSPVFTITVVLTLAVGIGANTAIFSIVDQLLLRPLPYPHGEQIVTMFETFANESHFSIMEGNHFHRVSPANWLDWQRDNRTLQSLAAWRTMSVTMTGVGDPVRLNGLQVSAEFFPLLGVPPLLGRVPSEADDRPNAPGVVVLSYQLWQRRFGGEAAIVGRVVQMNDRPFEVIGVMPQGFRFIFQDTDLWGAYRLDRAQAWRQTSGRFMNVVARLKPDTSIAAARADIDGLAQRLSTVHEFNKGTSVTMLPLRQELTGQVESSLLVLYAAVGVLLAIACFNVASLLLARASSRRRELALRSSLGAGQWAIVRQLLVESLLLAIAGGVLGVFLAGWTLDALVAFAPADLLRASELRVDRRIMFYALGLSIATGVIVGLVPAMMAARQSLIGSLRSSGSSVTQSPRLRQGLVVCQVAMTVVLLCGAGLLMQTVLALQGANNGLDRHGVLTMEVGLPPTRYPAPRRITFYQNAVAALRTLPGVASAAAANSLPVIGGPSGGTVFHRLGTPEVPINERPLAVIRVVTAGYFRALGIPVIRGREFVEADEAVPVPGFVVNQAFVNTFLKGLDPLGESLSVWMQSKNPHAPIIGVVGDVSEGGVRNAAEPTVFYSHGQLSQTSMTLFLRANQPAAQAAPAVAALRALDPNLAVSRIQTFDDAVAESLARDRLSALVSSAFALCALLLVSLGLYGLLAFLVTERTKELGIRIALGAHVGRLTRSVLGGGLMLVGVGAAIGLGGAFLLLRAIGTLLFGVTPQDLSTYAVVLGVLFTVAAAASYLPARRAARIEPLVALRQD
jgi:putative ABC transport system permease protein